MKFLVFTGLFYGIAAVCSRTYPSNHVVSLDTVASKSDTVGIREGNACSGEIDLNDVFPPQNLKSDYSLLPKFPGGLDSLRNWLQENVQFPKNIDTTSFKNRIMVKIIIDTVGKLHVDYLGGKSG